MEDDGLIGRHSRPYALSRAPVMNDSVPIRTPRWWRSGRIWVIASGALAGLCMATLLVWSANDASFRPALLQWEVSLGLKQMLLAGPNLGGDLGLNDPLRAIRWDGLGKRVIALHVLVWTGVAATAILAILAFWPKKSMRRMLAAIGFVVGWGLLCGTQTLVDDWRARRQLAAIFPRIEAAGLALNKEWPTETGRITPEIAVFVDTSFPPNLLFVLGQEEYPFQESLGLLIRRWKNGAINLELSARTELCVEYHPQGTLPAMQKDGGFGFPTPPVARYYLIKDNWYLVRYGG